MRFCLFLLVVLLNAGCGPKAPPPSASVQNATLNVKTTPYDTEVTVNGEKRGKTPLSLKVKPEALYAVALANNPVIRKEVTFGYADYSTKEVVLPSFF